MPTTKQTALIDELLVKLTDDEQSLCEPVIGLLLELGYTVKRRKKSTFTVEFERFGRMIVKLEHGKAYMTDPTPHLMFWLRFSACDDYPKVFQDAVDHRPEAWVKRGQHWTPKTFDCCGLCRGKPRFYRHTAEDGSRFDFCGGFTKWVPGVTAQDVPDILRMIREQDAHFADMCG